MTASPKPIRPCPDCAADEPIVAREPDRRAFLQSSLAVIAASSSLPLWATPKTVAQPTSNAPSETAVKAFFDTITPEQRKVICFPWDFQDPKRGLLRTRVANNWQITKPTIDSDFFTKTQRGMLHDIFRGLFQPEWVAKIEKQLKDDTQGKPWGAGQSVAIFGHPGAEKFEFVMTGRHLTIRADGDSEAHVALGGPIFHGHAAESDNEKPNHPGNVFWHQALEANKVFEMLSGKQRASALVEHAPKESDVPLRGAGGPFPGLAVREMSSDQKGQVEKTLKSLVAPYRECDQKEIFACVKKQGGLEACSLAFYKDADIGDDGVWDNWRLEGPSLVWYFRGDPHVHIWINVADSPEPKLNAQG